MGVLSNQAQNKLNKYSVISIPNQFEFQDSTNEYNLNQTLKASLSKYNFKTFTNDEPLPKDVNACDVLRLKINKSGFLSNKMSLSFYDCFDKEVYTSVEGVSRIKEFRPSYYEAIGIALKDENIVNHKLQKEITITTSPEKHVVIENKKQTPKETVVLELRGKHYKLIQTNATDYQVYQENKLIGTLIKQPENDYIMKAGSLSGLGNFDDFGNFIITRVNPANKAVITDTMARVH